MEILKRKCGALGAVSSTNRTTTVRISHFFLPKLVCLFGQGLRYFDARQATQHQRCVMAEDRVDKRGSRYE